MTEVWKDIDGYSGYQISSFGRIKSFRRAKVFGKLIQPQFDEKGYLRVRLYKTPSSIQTHKVHRLVATAFVFKPFLKEDTNHRDGNKTNNYYKNLEWVTKSENALHRVHTLGIRPVGNKTNHKRKAA